ncbi:peptidylprolyl isomerase [Leeia sp. TBRC 13508]|uniref:peptidylprolyl isomerase n=1 Tax=Leeia speluncae TaxID=2884804 RepID=A0ABS8D213_9NEIS|nr:peptidylprolyl isomerase [Leeia speluncae]MCB6182215.1 peptidylprolyl isomerase [Leeia speluncae]
MRKTLLAVALSAGILSVANAADVKVNGVVVPEARLEAMVKEAVARGQQDTPELRASIKDRLVMTVALSQKATEAGFDKQPAFIEQMEVAKINLLAQAYVQDYLGKNPITEVAVKAQYDKLKPEWEKEAAGAEKLYKARHILVKSEKEAKDLVAQLKKGANFAELAKKYSIDKGSAVNGGQLDYAAPGNYVKEFADALRKMPKGKISDAPIKTQFGWHLIQVDDIKAQPIPSYEETKGQIQQQLQQEQIQKFLEDVKKGAKVE